MEHVSNEQKAKKIANKAMNNEDYARHLCCSGCNNYVCYTNQKQCQTLNDLLTMAEWKDKQFEKEKQQLIDKACEWIKILMVASGNYDAYDIQENLKDFKKAMKEE